MNYPDNWPRCPSCGDNALDGHITCGLAECDESSMIRVLDQPASGPLSRLHECPSDGCEDGRVYGARDASYRNCGDCHGAGVRKVKCAGCLQPIVGVAVAIGGEHYDSGCALWHLVGNHAESLINNAASLGALSCALREQPLLRRAG